MNAKDIFEKLKTINVRIFALRIGREIVHWIHDNKTTQEWRHDIANFRDNSAQVADDWAEDNIQNNLYRHLTSLGYYEVSDVVADVFEGRISVLSAKLIDDPDHDDIQKDGFGHYGWDKP